MDNNLLKNMPQYLPKNTKRVRFSPEKPSINIINISDEEKKSKKKHSKKITKHITKKKIKKINKEYKKGNYDPHTIRKQVIKYLSK